MTDLRAAANLQPLAPIPQTVGTSRVLDPRAHRRAERQAAREHALDLRRHQQQARRNALREARSYMLWGDHEGTYPGRRRGRMRPWFAYTMLAVTLAIVAASAAWVISIGVSMGPDTERVRSFGDPFVTIPHDHTPVARMIDGVPTWSPTARGTTDSGDPGWPAGEFPYQGVPITGTAPARLMLPVLADAAAVAARAVTAAEPSLSPSAVTLIAPGSNAVHVSLRLLAKPVPGAAVAPTRIVEMALAKTAPLRWQWRVQSIRPGSND